ncbi:Na(+)/citrate cotransporter-like isoform X2 [Neocloeon triangulifer]|nr:Na(+)/citrate cotransporter-like isoform X2 [Neocloeon triangulifer]
MKTPALFDFIRPHWRSVVIVLAPLLLLPLLIVSPSKEAKCGYVVLLMAIFWMTEALPLAVTSLFPVVFFPLFGVMSTESVCIQYLKETNMMFIGGLIVAIAIEHCNLHKRIALKVLLLVGTSPRLLMLGFMLNTMFLSMWISNTACTAMMVPILQAVLTELKESKMLAFRRSSSIRISISAPRESVLENQDSQRNLSITEVETTVVHFQTAIPTQDAVAIKQAEERLQKEIDQKYYRDTICYFLAIAYAANIGGTGTITGTGTNLTFLGIFNSAFPNATGLNFATWMIFNVPMMLLNILMAWLWLQIVYMGLCRKGKSSDEGNPKAVRQLISTKYRELGPMSYHEANVLALFIILILLWFFRKPDFIPGWASLLPAVKIDDSTPAILIVIIMFILPANLDFFRIFLDNDEKHTTFGRKRTAAPSLIDWPTVQRKLPWGLVLMLGGGFAMAQAVKESGLSAWLGQELVGLSVLPPWLVVSVICLMATFATEVSSNTAIANILLPVLAEMSKVVRQHPLYLMMPATLCCSYSFMLPVATPPNAIVAEASKMKTKDMVKSGIVMNLLTVGALILMFNTLGVIVYDLDTFPSWAEPNATSVSKIVHRIAFNHTTPISLSY